LPSQDERGRKRRKGEEGMTTGNLEIQAVWMGGGEDVGIDGGAKERASEHWMELELPLIDGDC